MPSDKARVELKEINWTGVSGTVRRFDALAQPAKSIDLASYVSVLATLADANAPHFVEGNEPVTDGRVFHAVEGKQYYRPTLRVAERPGSIAGPDVRFVKDAEGVVRLQFELEEAPSGHNNAQPLNVHVTGLTLQWPGGSKSFASPTLAFVEPGDSGSHFYLRAGTTLEPSEVETLYGALTGGATLKVDMSYGYWVDPRPARPRRPTSPPVVHLDPVIGKLKLAGNIVRMATRSPLERRGRVVGRELPASWNVLVDKARKEKSEREDHGRYRTATLSRTLDFHFDPNLAQNRPIYASIRSDGSGVNRSWTDTDYGYIRLAEFANTVYRLPDELRLAYNPELGTPHVIPQLYRDDDQAIRVRVTLRIIPWHDPQEIVALRDFLYRDTAGAVANPSIVVGGYESASLRFTTAFPEEIKVLEGDEVDISLENGVDMTLDLSLEFYRYLAELLTSPVGVTGEVAVTLAATPDEDDESEDVEAIVKRVPLRLVLGDLAGVAFEPKVPQDTISPTEVSIVNPSRADLEVGACLPRLLQVDDNSVVPVAVLEAHSIGTFPVTVPAGGGRKVQLKADDEDSDEVWNAVQVELVDANMSAEPTSVLDRIHELAPSGSLAWKIAVECPVFLAPSIPDRFANVYRVHVEVSREGFAPQQTVLGPGQATGTISMQRTLKELMGDEAAALNTFTYQVRNIYYDHEGSWSDTKTGSGENLFVFPNDPTDD